MSGDVIVVESDMKIIKVCDGINVYQHVNGFYNGSAMCLEKQANIVDFFRLNRTLKYIKFLGGVDKHRMKVKFNGKYIILISITLLPYLAHWLYPEFYVVILACFSKSFQRCDKKESTQSKELEEVSKINREQQERLALCRKVNIETVDDLNTALSSNRVQQVKILELESAIDQQGSELAEFAARLTQAGYEYRELKDKHDVIYGCYQEGLEIHVKHLEYTHTIELERDDLKERLGLSQVVTTPEDDLQHNKEIQQHNKEIEDIIRDRAEKKKRIIDEEAERYRLIKEEEERIKMIEEDERRQKIKRMIEEEDLELQECLATKKRKFEQMFIDKVIYKKVN
jgi:hypothetical protein